MISYRVSVEINHMHWLFLAYTKIRIASICINIDLQRSKYNKMVKLIFIIDTDPVPYLKKRSGSGLNFLIQNPSRIIFF